MKTCTRLTKNDLGKKRVVTKFLWLPRTFCGKKKWLRKVRIVEQVKLVNAEKSDSWKNLTLAWVEIDFY